MLPYAIMALGYAAAWAAGRLLRMSKKSWIRYASQTHFLFDHWKTSSTDGAASLLLLGALALTVWIDLNSSHDLLFVYLLGGMLMRAGHGWYLRRSARRSSGAGTRLRH